MNLYLLCFFLSCCTVTETFSYFSLYDLSLSSQPFTFYPQTFLLNQTSLSNAWLLVHVSSLLSIFKTFLLYPSAPSIFEFMTHCQQIWSRTGYCYGVVSYKAFQALLPFSVLLCVSTWVLIIHDLSTRALLLQQRHLLPRQGVGEKWPWI
jgi:hypothetical protein